MVSYSVYYAPTQGALSNDAVCRLPVWRLSRTSSRWAAWVAGRLDDAYWLIGFSWPGSSLPLHASIAGLGGGISWRLLTYSLLYKY